MKIFSKILVIFELKEKTESVTTRSQKLRIKLILKLNTWPLWERLLFDSIYLVTQKNGYAITH